MPTFLFWNLRARGARETRPLREVIAQLAHDYRIDVLAFAECEIPPATLLRDLNENQGIAAYFYSPSTVCKKIELFTRFLPDFAPPIADFETERLTVRHLALPGLRSILLAVVHGRSKYMLSVADINQANQAREVARRIQAAERAVGHNRTVLVGDLNMNPFEAGVVDATGLHAVMTRQLASQAIGGARERMPRFYNPMWGHYGDRAPGPPGTYYYKGGDDDFAYHWHLFDQVLIRPDLLSAFSNESLHIVDTVRNTSLVSAQGIPKKSDYSDHLPILFDLDL
jgi:endonuclease/exonuclease/phosphatase family metal-dependent hydrolase